MSLRLSSGLLTLALSAGFAVPGTAQEVLPRSTNRNSSAIRLTSNIPALQAATITII